MEQWYIMGKGTRQKIGSIGNIDVKTRELGEHGTPTGSPSFIGIKWF